MPLTATREAVEIKLSNGELRAETAHTILPLLELEVVARAGAGETAVRPAPRARNGIVFQGTLSC